MENDGKQLEFILPDEPAAKAEDKDQPIVEFVNENDEVVSRSDNTSDDGDNEDVHKKLKALEKKLKEERKARLEAEDRARQASQVAQSAYGEVEDTNLHLVNTAIDTVGRENEILTNQYADAMAAGDYNVAAKIQRAMSTNEARLLQLQNGKAAMESRPRQQAPAHSDPVEQFASQLSSRSAEWVRNNPQCVTDPRLQQKMVAAHNLAVADGFTPDSDDYFGFIEDTLRLNKRSSAPQEQEVDSPLSSASKSVSRQAAPAAAPVNRDGNGRQNIVRLTPAEVEMAKNFGQTPEEYARNKMLLKKEGRMH
jgi:hypothetical protein